MTMSIAEYARHRKAAGLPGGDAKSVRLAISSGRITATADGMIADAAVADREWESSTKAEYRPLTGPTAPPETNGHSNPLAEARARREAAQASLREMELAEKLGKLAPVAEMEARMVQVFSSCKTKLLGIPSGCRQEDPALTAKQVAMIERRVRAALEDLAGSNE